MRNPSTEREKRYRCVSREALRLAADASTRMSVTSSSDEGVVPAKLAKLRRLLLELDELVPLERDPGAGVIEVLQVDISSHSGHAWVCVKNAIGEREDVTTFGCSAAYASLIEQWSRCREESLVEDTRWDRGRSVRRVVDYDGQPSLVDAGAVAVCDMLEAGGICVSASCEGHPWGGYLLFEGDRAREAARQFADFGWSIEKHFEKTVVRMPMVQDVHTRDAIWRSTCDALHRTFTVEQDMAVRTPRMG